MYSILHVDNSIFFKRILEEVAEDNQFKLYSETSPGKALKILEENKIDLVITGLELKEMNGMDFIRYMNKSDFRRIPKVILSSNDTVEIRKKADALGVMDVLQKDISLNSLYAFFERIKNQRAVKRALESMAIAVVEPGDEGIREIQEIFKKENINNVSYFKDVDTINQCAHRFSVYLINITSLGRSTEKMIIDIRRENMNAIIIAMSDAYETESVSNILLAGADDYIIQPINHKVFMARVNANVRLQMHLEKIEHQNEELERINSELNRLVITDGLTGLFNHKYTIERLGVEIEKASRYKRNLVLLMMDIDHFKQVNDTYGHQLGDQVLTKVSETIRYNLRKVDIVGRYGGEEFLVILPEADLEKGVQAGEKIRGLIEGLTFDDPNLRVTISGGICAWNKEDVSDLIRTADEYLYMAKEMGRNQMIHAPEIREESVKIL